MKLPKLSVTEKWAWKNDFAPQYEKHYKHKPRQDDEIDRHCFAWFSYGFGKALSARYLSTNTGKNKNTHKGVNMLSKVGDALFFEGTEWVVMAIDVNPENPIFATLAIAKRR
jgi:hypothetical protein